jgi:hypothetical protein
VTIRTRADLGNSAVPECVGRLGGEGFWVRDYGGGVRVGPTGPGRSPFWRMLSHACVQFPAHTSMCVYISIAYVCVHKYSM